MHQLVGAYVLDSINEDDVRFEFERHLRSCGDCRVEVLEFQESAAALADRVAFEPPSRLRHRVLTEVARTRQLPPDSPAPRHLRALPKMLAKLLLSR